MAKRLTITQEILDRIKNSTGEDLSSEAIAVFEAIALTNKPIVKRGSIYSGAVHSDSILKEMADFLQGEGNFVPLHTRHLQGAELPLGRVFYGEFVRDDVTGLSKLHVLFYLPTKEEDLVNKLDQAVIDEVSVSLLPKHLICSECGWDFRGEDATEENLWTQTCANGHTIGEDGVHLLVNGLERFYEMSLVSLGASQGAKILPRAKQLLAADDYARLAAAGTPAEAIVLTANHREEKTMAIQDTGGEAVLTAQFATMTNDLVEAKASLKISEAALAAANTQVTDLTAKLEASEAKVTTDVAEMTTKLDAAQATVDTALAFLQDQAKMAMVASGEKDPAAPETIEACIDAVEKAKVKLANLFPAGGVSQGTITDAEKAKSESARLASFQMTN